VAWCLAWGMMWKDHHSQPSATQDAVPTTTPPAQHHARDHSSTAVAITGTASLTLLLAISLSHLRSVPALSLRSPSSASLTSGAASCSAQVVGIPGIGAKGGRPAFAAEKSVLLTVKSAAARISCWRRTGSNTPRACSNGRYVVVCQGGGGAAKLKMTAACC